MDKGIRPAVLRRFYEITYNRGESPDAYRNATFEEYYALQRILFPGITRWAAASRAVKEEFRELAFQFEPDPPDPDPPEQCYVHIDRKKVFNLGDESIDPAVQRLVLDRIKSLSGWRKLERFANLDELSLILSGSDDPEPARHPIAIRRIRVAECTWTCMMSALSSTNATEVELRFEERPVVDLSILRTHPRIEDLWARADLLRGMSQLAHLPLQVLAIGKVEPDDELGATLRALGSTLRELTIIGSRPFGPAALLDTKDLPALSRLCVPAYPQFREDWIEFALTNPHVGCEFLPYEPPNGKASSATIEELYRDVDILHMQKGAKSHFEISGDFAELRAEAVPGWEGDNGDLHDELKAAVRKAKRKFTWSDESDTLTVQAADVDSLRWLIDQILSPPSSVPPAPPHTATKARKKQNKG